MFHDCIKSLGYITIVVLSLRSCIIAAAAQSPGSDPQQSVVAGSSSNSSNSNSSSNSGSNSNSNSSSNSNSNSSSNSNSNSSNSNSSSNNNNNSSSNSNSNNSNSNNSNSNNNNSSSNNNNNGIDSGSSTSLGVSTGTHDSSKPEYQAKQPPPSAREIEERFQVDRVFCTEVFDAIDKFVQKEFYNAVVATRDWPEIAKRHRNGIVESRNLTELTQKVNEALGELKASHTQFMTINDEHFYFLHSLFDSFKSPEDQKKTPQAEFIGVGLGGPSTMPHQVRYVLNHSPAATAGLRRGDILLKVNERPYIGQLSFAGTAGTSVKLLIKRGNSTVDLIIRPVQAKFYDAYLESTRKSARVIRTGKGAIGYMHLWCGGMAGSLLSDAVSDELASTSSMIVDLRDGYGGNSLQDWDIFYRPPNGYPEFRTFGRKNKQQTRLTYTRPLAVLINGGSRSGKELLAFSLKCSRRGTLIGERTAGAVLAGRMFRLNDRCALYLAVMDGTIGGKRLEGTGVAPDVVIPYPLTSTEDTQLQAALKLLPPARKR